MSQVPPHGAHLTPAEQQAQGFLLPSSCVLASHIPGSGQGGEEEDGVVLQSTELSPRAAATAEAPPRLVAFRLSFSSFLLHKVQTEVNLKPSSLLLTPVVGLGRWLQQRGKISLLERQDKIQSIQ